MQPTCLARRNFPQEDFRDIYSLGEAMSVNTSVVRGELSSIPDVRTLASGTELATLQLTTRPHDGAAISVPIAIAQPPAWIAKLEAGDEVIAFGVVRRRFFRAGGATASRVEIDATVVARGNDKRAIARIQRLAAAAIAALSAPAT